MSLWAGMLLKVFEYFILLCYNYNNKNFSNSWSVQQNILFGLLYSFHILNMHNLAVSFREYVLLCIFLEIISYFRTSLDLSTLKKEKSHYMKLSLEDQLGFICLHLSITALHGDECISNSSNYEENNMQMLKKEFSLWKTANSFKEIGWLQVRQLKR